MTEKTELSENLNIDKDSIENVYRLVDEGTWWVDKEDLQEPAFISELKMLNGVIHTVVVSLFSHTGKNEKYNRTEDCLVDDFIKRYTFCDPEETLALKNFEMRRLQGSINQLASNIGNEEKMLLIGSEKSASDNTKNEVKPEANKLMLQNLKNTHIAIRETKELIGKETEELGNRAKEIAENQKSQHNKSMQIVSAIENRIYTLDMYIGDSVDITIIKTGEPANKNNKVVLIQEKCFVDEESLINAIDGGATFKDEAVFFDMLKNNQKLVDRILPFEKCVVVMAHRRKNREISSLSLAEHISNMEEGRLNAEEFFLIKNGEKIFAVHSPMIFLDSLFANKEESKRFYKDNRWHTKEKNIDINSVFFVDCHNKHTMKLEHYKRIFIMLVGCYERQPEIFSPIKTETKKNHANLFDMEFHNDIFERFNGFSNHLVDKNKPDFKTFINEKNKGIKKGSRVVISLQSYCDNNNHKAKKNTFGYASTEMLAPALYAASRSDYNYGNADSKYNMNFHEKATGIIKVEKDRLYIKQPFFRNLYTKRHAFRISKGQAKVYMPDIEDLMSEELNIGLLCIDDISVRDILYYANHKIYRKDYIKYVPVLQMAYQSLKNNGVINLEDGKEYEDIYGHCVTVSKKSENEFISKNLVIYNSEGLVLDASNNKEFGDIKWKRTDLD